MRTDFIMEQARLDADSAEGVKSYSDEDPAGSQARQIELGRFSA
jgi:hypothetical protein